PTRLSFRKGNATERAQGGVWRCAQTASNLARPAIYRGQRGALVRQNGRFAQHNTREPQQASLPTLRTVSPSLLTARIVRPVRRRVLRQYQQFRPARGVR